MPGHYWLPDTQIERIKPFFPLSNGLLAGRKSGTTCSIPN